MRLRVALVVLVAVAGLGAWVFTVLRASEADRVAPTVTLVSPTTGAVVGDALPLIARARDAGSGVDRVDFFVDGEWVATATAAPWTVRWEGAGEEPGERLVQAKATDVAGNSRYSAEADVTVVDHEPPAIGILDVATGASGSTVRVAATDNVAVARVEVFAGTELVGVDHTRPFEVDVATPGAHDGVLKAKAVDTSGNVRYSEPFARPTSPTG